MFDLTYCSLIIKCSLCFILLSDELNGLQTLLGFLTGLDTIPSLGFDPSPRLKFYHPNPVDEYDGLPYANTCASILNIPVLCDYDLFVG